MAVAPHLAIPVSSSADTGACGPIQLEQLRKVPLFSGLDTAALEKLCTLLVSHEFKGPARIFQAGDSGDALYLIERGRVHISVTDADGREVTLADLGEGNFFGEMALIDGHERSADATIDEDVRLAVLTRADFLDFITSNTNVMLGMLAAMARRLRRTDNLLRHRVSRNANAEEAARTTVADRAADTIANFGGSWKFIGLCGLLLFSWIVLNSWMLSRGSFDPYPFVLLNLVLGIITGLQAPIIMMSQNRQAHKDRLRADLDYQLNLKNELLLAEILRLLHDQERNESRGPQQPATLPEFRRKDGSHH
ncbi:MAG: DUF1003 domain-containing protein [Chthoniobacterales bacterium]